MSNNDPKLWQSLNILHIRIQYLLASSAPEINISKSSCRRWDTLKPHLSVVLSSLLAARALQQQIRRKGRTEGLPSHSDHVRSLELSCLLAKWLGVVIWTHQ